jgi:hypothetical protein
MPLLMAPAIGFVGMLLGMLLGAVFVLAGRGRGGLTLR